MGKPVTVMIGGAAVAVPTEFNFAKLKACRPYLDRIATGADLFDMTEIAIGVVAVALINTQPLTPELIAEQVADIENRLLPAEIADLCGAPNKIMIACGFWKETPAGEAKPAGKPTRRTSTGL